MWYFLFIKVEPFIQSWWQDIWIEINGKCLHAAYRHNSIECVSNSLFFSCKSNSTFTNVCSFVHPSVCLSVCLSVRKQNPSTAWNHHPSSFIIHPSSFFFHPLFFILHHSSLSFFIHPLSFFIHPSSFFIHPSIILRLLAFQLVERQVWGHSIPSFQ